MLAGIEPPEPVALNEEVWAPLPAMAAVAVQELMARGEVRLRLVTCRAKLTLDPEVAGFGVGVSEPLSVTVLVPAKGTVHE